MNCPPETRLLQWLLGELSVNDSNELERHRAACLGCRTRLHAWEQLLADLSAAPRLERSDEEFTARVLSACVELGPTPVQTRERADPRVWWGMALAAAAVLLWVSPWSRSEQRALEQIRARGSAGAREHATADAELFYVRTGRARPLAGAQLRRGDGLAVRCSNFADAPLYLAVFALDAAGETHWVYPAYLDPDTDPEALPIAPHTRNLALDELVELDAPAPGALRLFALFSERPLHVRELERALASSSDPHLESVERFGTKHLEEWSAAWIGD